MAEVASLRTSAEVEALLIELLGEPLPPDAGTVHVTSAWEAPGGALWTLRIDAASPKSPHDFFLLQSARARADTIVVTGKVLRDEPGLRYDFEGPGTSGAALRAYRRERMGREAPPRLLVLTRRDDLDLDHPALHGEMPATILTDPATAGVIRARAAGALDVVGIDGVGVEAAIAHARGPGRARTVTLEAGPSVMAPLYDPPKRIDELLLGLYRGPAPAPSRLAGALPSLDRLHTLFGARSTPHRVLEPSGAWEFLRFHG